MSAPSVRPATQVCAACGESVGVTCRNLCIPCRNGQGLVRDVCTECGGMYGEHRMMDGEPCLRVG